MYFGIKKEVVEDKKTVVLGSGGDTFTESYQK